jgi:hypothetical protein
MLIFPFSENNDCKTHSGVWRYDKTWSGGKLEMIMMEKDNGGAVWQPIRVRQDHPEEPQPQQAFRPLTRQSSLGSVG